MKRLIIIIAVVVGFAQMGMGQEEPQRKKIALVLSGGGAKGVAHIGVLKVLERAGMPIDIITGTSMGSIIGGLYACGNDAMRLDSLFRAQDWATVLSDKDDLRYQSLKEREQHNTYALSTSLRLKKKKRATIGGGFIIGKNIGRMLRTLTIPYTDSIDFDALPIRFACVATDVVDNSEQVFHSGVLSEAMRASMSIPGAFSPVRKGDKVLVDGGLRNNYPADIAKEMGADYIIGVSVASKLRTAERLNSTGDILLQIVDFNTKNKFDENMAITDLPIIVNTEGYSTASFSASAIDTLIQRGEDAAMEHWDEIVALKEKLFPAQTPPRRIITQSILSDNPTYRIGQLRFENMTPSDETFLRTKFKLREGDSINTERANLITVSIRLDLFYQSADIRVENNAIDMDDGTKAARIIFIAGEKKPNKMSVGIRFDNKEMVALQSNIAFPLRKRLPMQLDFTVRLGKHIMAKADYELHPTNFLHPTLALAFHRNDINLFEYGAKSYNLTYNRLAAEAVPLSFFVRNFHISLGAAMDYYFNNNLLLDQVKEHQMEIPDHEHFISYFAKVSYNSENNWYFPTRGSKFSARYGYYTDNFVKLHDEIGMHEVSMMWRTNFPVGRCLAIQPMLYGRLLHCKETPVIISNIVGGEWFGHYIDQQLPFAGMGNMELQWDKFFAAQMQAQYSMTTNNHLLLRFAAAQNSDKYKDVLKSKTMLGALLSYYYNAPTGPIGGSMGYSNVTEKLYFYFNLGFVF
ncbi:MAG: patatin-like phospholipase family protein [Prevotella sp.]|nr:patatin-like phospholipase family protein [Prevotella sp.]